jgi:hypothetical protein
MKSALMAVAITALMGGLVIGPVTQQAAEAQVKRDNFIYFNDQSFGGVRVKNFKALYTAKDTRLGQEQSLKIPALYDLWWDPGRELRHRVQRCGADAGRLQDLARPLFRPGQWLDRPLHQPRDDAVLG